MFGLPKSTELERPQQIPKTTIFATFQMNASEKAQINEDISRISITNEFSKTKISIEEGTNIKNFFVMNVAIKNKEFRNATIVKIAKLIPQNILMVLNYENEVKLAVYHTKLLQTDWMSKADCNIEIKGMNLDAVWDNIIAQIGGLVNDSSISIDEQLVLKEKKEKLEKEITKLERQARAENQPRKKFEIVKQIQKLQNEVSRLQVEGFN